MSNFETAAKFGGTSVVHPHLVRQHIEHDDPWIVVISALGVDPVRSFNTKLTDDVLNSDDVRAVALKSAQRLSLLAQDMGLQRTLDIFEHADNLEVDMLNFQVENWPIGILPDMWTTGYYARYLNRVEIDPAYLVQFNEAGQLEVQASERAIRRAFDPSRRYVIAGASGGDESARRYSLGRNGSNTTLALIGRALGLAEIHNYSDVDGFMSANPRYDPSARLLEQLNYDQVLAMTERGCNLLHPDVCRLLGETAVTTIMRNTFGPVGNRGTLVGGAPLTAQVS